MSICILIIIISNCERSDQFGSYETTPSKICLCVCMCVLSVCPSVRPSVFYLLLDHWRDRNETFRGRRHQPLDGFYILKTYCCYVNFIIICEKLSSRLYWSHIFILTFHRRHLVLPPISLSTSLLLPPISLSTSYLQPPFLPPTSYLHPPIIPPTSLSISYLLWYLLFDTSYFPFYLLPISYLLFYLLPPILPLTSLSTSYLPFHLLPPFLPVTFLSDSHLPSYLLRPFLPSTYLLPPLLSPISFSTFYLAPTSYLPFYPLHPFLPPLSTSHLFKSQLYHWFPPSSPFITWVDRMRQGVTPSASNRTSLDFAH